MCVLFSIHFFSKKFGRNIITTLLYYIFLFHHMPNQKIMILSKKFKKFLLSLKYHIGKNLVLLTPVGLN